MTQRRSFLKSTIVASLGGSAFNIIADTKKSVTVGEGEYVYECHHHWGQLPEGHHYGGASHGTAIDAAGMIYISHQGSPGSVFVFDPQGRFVKSLIPEHGKPGDSSSGHGIDIRREHDGREYLYLSPSDSAMAFTKATLDGEIVWTRGKADLEQDSGQKLARYRPTNVSFAPDGSVYLGDGYGSGFIFRYTSGGEYMGIFGGGGIEDGKFKTPHGQWLDMRDGTPKTVVCDRASKRLQWFDLEGQHLRTMEGFLFPADIDIQGELMLVPDLHARITILDGKNQVVAQLGDDEPWRNRVLDKTETMRAKPEKWLPGRFVHPHDACFDRQGNIFVAEWVVGGRVTKLARVS
tara:strand:- start:6109 stop:7155 length:1047 start_codon:yes stop_codon:yes gene_type:complete